MKTKSSIDFEPNQVIDKIVRLFILVGIWPADYEFRTLYIVYGIAFQFTFSYAYAMFNLINLFVVTDLSVITEQIFIVLPMVSMCLRMTNFVVRFKEMKNFLAVINSFEVFNQEELDLYKARLSRFVSVMIFYLSCAVFAVSFSNCAPLFDKTMRLPYPGWYPLDWGNILWKLISLSNPNISALVLETNVTYYWTLYAYQFIGISFLSSTLVNLENYQIYCMVSATIQIEIIGMRLRRLGHQIKCKNKNETEMVYKQRQDLENLEDLVQCIKDHEFAMKFNYSPLGFLSYHNLIYFTDLYRILNEYSIYHFCFNCSVAV